MRLEIRCTLAAQDAALADAFGASLAQAAAARAAINPVAARVQRISSRIRRPPEGDECRLRGELGRRSQSTLLHARW